MRCWKHCSRVADFLRCSARTGTLGRILRCTVGLLLAAQPLWASQLGVPASSPSDGALGGNTVALPMNASTALFNNPAQLSLLPPSFSSGLMALRFHPSYTSPLGYDSTSRELPLAPNFGYVTDAFGPFRFAIGAYGSLGFMFNHRADPAHGVLNNFFTELASVSLAPSIAYSVGPNLHLGVSLNPTYGRLKFKTPSPAGRLDVDARGPGVFGTLGLLYQPTGKLNLGLTYKTPGNIWMFGNARVAGRGDDSTVSFKIPQNVKLGFAYRLTNRVTLTGQGSWTQYSVFEDSRLRFSKRSFLNSPAVRDAKDRWRIGAGVQVEIMRGVKFRLGFSYEPWAIKDAALTPTLADTTDYLFPMGLAIERGGWQIDLGGGPSHTEPRRVDQKENPFFAGRYSLDAVVFGIQVTRLFEGPSIIPRTESRRAARVRYAGVPDSYATISEGRAETVLGTLIGRLAADQCHDLSPLYRAVPGCSFGIEVVGFVGSHLPQYAALTDGPARNGPIPPAASEPILDSLIERLTARQCRDRSTGQPPLPGCG